MPTSGHLRSLKERTHNWAHPAATPPKDVGSRGASNCRRRVRPRSTAVRFEHIPTATTLPPTSQRVVDPRGQRSHRRGDCVAARWRSPRARTPRPAAPRRHRSAHYVAQRIESQCRLRLEERRRSHVPASSASKMCTAPACLRSDVHRAVVAGVAGVAHSKRLAIAAKRQRLAKHIRLWLKRRRPGGTQFGRELPSVRAGGARLVDVNSEDCPTASTPVPRTMRHWR